MAAEDVKFRNGVRTVLHLAVDAPSGVPDTAEDFLARLDVGWLSDEWSERRLESSLVETVARGAVPILSWVELIYANVLAPWSGEPTAVAARGLFPAGPHSTAGEGEAP